MRTSAYANIDLIRAYYPLEKKGFLELSVEGTIKKGGTITLIARISSTINIEEEVMVGIPSLHNNIELLSNKGTQKVYLKAEEPHDIKFDLKLKETGTYYIPVIFFFSLNRIDYEKIHKDVYIEVAEEDSRGGCWDLVNDTDGRSIDVKVNTRLTPIIDQTRELVNKSRLKAIQQSSINQSYVAAQASPAVQQSTVIQTSIGGQTFASLCPSGCECLTAPDAEKKFGSGSLKSCSDKVCGYGWVGDLNLPKYCYSAIALNECIDTDGGKNYEVKGSVQGYVDQCSEFSHPPEVVKEYYAEIVNGKCQVNIDYHDCGSICEDGKCLPPTCNDWIQNQGEEGVDCGGPCSNPCVCPSGCKCVTGIEAENKFGQGQYTSCTIVPDIKE